MRSKELSLVCLSVAALCIGIAVFLIPPAISDASLARVSYWSLGIGLVLLAIAAVLWPGGFFSVSNLHTEKSSNRPDSGLPFWRAVTVLTWIITIPNILFLFAYAMLALLAGALDDMNEAWEILIPQASTAGLLIVTLLMFAPRNTPNHATGLRRLLSLAPVMLVFLFWWSWQHDFWR